MNTSEGYIINKALVKNLKKEIESLRDTLAKKGSNYAMLEAENRYLHDLLRRLEAENKELKDKYYELLYAVEQKFPGETRHETALRYIRQREENKGGNIPQQALTEDG